jgi:hypothetical protein
MKRSLQKETAGFIAKNGLAQRTKKGPLPSIEQAIASIVAAGCRPKGGFGGPPPINKKTKQYTRAQITRKQAYQSIACYNCTQIHNNCVQFGTSDVLLLVICNSVKMGIRLCYKWVPAQING